MKSNSIKTTLSCFVYLLLAANDSVAQEKPDILFIAIKPQQIAEALAPLAEAVTADQLVISIAAGRTIASIEALLPAARVVRIMPNLPCQVAEGMTAFCLGHKTRTGDQRIVGELLACFGRVLEMPESKFDVVTAISGSGPAFFAHFLCRIVEAGVANGLTNDEATLLAEQTMLGTARVLLTGETHPHDFIRAVTSPQGTTEAGLTALASPVLADLVNGNDSRMIQIRSRLGLALEALQVGFACQLPCKDHL